MIERPDLEQEREAVRNLWIPPSHRPELSASDRRFLTKAMGVSMALLVLLVLVVWLMSVVFA